MQTPPPRLIRTFRDAEVAARDWVAYMGFSDAALTSMGPDGGVDVSSSRAVAQVKAEVRPTGRPVVQQIYGVASQWGKVPLLFSLGGFTPEAVEWANSAGVALFTFDLVGQAVPENVLASRLKDAGGRALPANAYAAWTPKEDALLAKRYEGKMDPEEIARLHGRTLGAIASRLVRLGKIASRDQIRPQRAGDPVHRDHGRPPYFSTFQDWHRTTGEEGKA